MKSIPEHLLPFLAKQDASLYTPIDHAGWRFILRISKAFFKQHAHPLYLRGLDETGIETEHIPLISEIDKKLQKFGWRAVAVSGFIPTSAFLEFQSLGILPIACEMRSLEHLAYTPAPDIVHEAAGHVPIVADPEYRKYLVQYGEVARKAIFSKKDQELFEAVRDLSDIKEDSDSSEAQIEASQKNLMQVVTSLEYCSEANSLARMAWWTTEYGMVGTLQNPKIFGAGLLSSVGESYGSLSDKVMKLPVTVDCVQTSFDITRPQPQLFVTPSFEYLGQVLEEFSKNMAYRRGGLEGLTKAKRAESVTTTVLDSHIQISGVLSEFYLNDENEPIFLKYSGPVQLSMDDRELKAQGTSRHSQGYSTPIGLIRSEQKMSNGLTKIQFQSEVILEGKCIEESAVLRTFENCTVKYKNQILYQPEWGPFDLAIGKTVVSVFGGAADRIAYLKATGGYSVRPQKSKTNLTPENRALNVLYKKIRDLRESKSSTLSALTPILAELDRNFKNDWLARLEILEIAPQEFKGLRSELEERSKSQSENAVLIKRGLELI